MRRVTSPIAAARAVFGAICLLLLTLMLIAPPDAVAQSRPNARVYDGTNCFSTVIPQITRTLARVSGSRQPGRQSFGGGETIYLQAEPDERIEPGQNYLMYRIEGVVRHPVSDDEVGNVIRLLGVVEVLDTEGMRGVARLIRTCGDIEIGDRVHPLLASSIPSDIPAAAFRPAQLIDPAESDAFVVYGSSESAASAGSSAARDGRRDMNMRASFAAGDVITIDQGSAYGWQVGAAVMLYESGTDEAWKEAGQSESVIVGQGVVIWLQPDTAAVLITDGDRDVQVGHRARPQSTGSTTGR